MLVVEEGQPNYIEQAFASMLHKAGRGTRLVGKEHLPMAGEYTGQVMLDGIGSFLRANAPHLLPGEVRAPNKLGEGVDTADLINVDGKGVLWGARLCGITLPERVAGIDIMTGLFALCAKKGFRPYLLGAEQSVLDAVEARLAAEYGLTIAGMQDGYFKPEQEAEIVAAINASGADCLFVAMPTPRKERFLSRYRAELKPSFIMGVGGSFDVYGGKVARAPKLVQMLGLEWLFRVVQEPGRLWRRYYETNTAYAGLLWREYWGRRSA